MDRPKLAIFQQPSKQQPSKDSSKESIEGKAGHRRKKMKKTRQGTDDRASSMSATSQASIQPMYELSSESKRKVKHGSKQRSTDHAAQRHTKSKHPKEKVSPQSMPMQARQPPNQSDPAERNDNQQKSTENEHVLQAGPSKQPRYESEKSSKIAKQSKVPESQMAQPTSPANIAIHMEQPIISTPKQSSSKIGARRSLYSRNRPIISSPRAAKRSAFDNVPLYMALPKMKKMDTETNSSNSTISTSSTSLSDSPRTVFDSIVLPVLTKPPKTPEEKKRRRANRKNPEANAPTKHTKSHKAQTTSIPKQQETAESSSVQVSATPIYVSQHTKRQKSAKGQQNQQNLAADANRMAREASPMKQQQQRANPVVLPPIQESGEGSNGSECEEGSSGSESEEGSSSSESEEGLEPQDEPMGGAADTEKSQQVATATHPTTPENQPQDEREVPVASQGNLSPIEESEDDSDAISEDFLHHPGEQSESGSSNSQSSGSAHTPEQKSNSGSSDADITPRRSYHSSQDETTHHVPTPSRRKQAKPVRKPVGPGADRIDPKSKAGPSTAPIQPSNKAAPPKRPTKANSSKPVKRHKPYGWHVIREIKKLQNSTNFLIPKLPFQRIVREIMLSLKDNFRIQGAAIEALQASTEMMMINILEDACLCTIHSKRQTIFVKDIILAMILRNDAVLKPK